MSLYQIPQVVLGSHMLMKLDSHEVLSLYAWPRSLQRCRVRNEPCDRLSDLRPRCACLYFLTLSFFNLTSHERREMWLRWEPNLWICIRPKNQKFLKFPGTLVFLSQLFPSPWLLLTQPGLRWLSSGQFPLHSHAPDSQLLFAYLSRETGHKDWHSLGEEVFLSPPRFFWLV